MKATKFSSNFESGKDINRSVDLFRIKLPKQFQKGVNVDFPIWMIESLDKEASRFGVRYRSTDRSATEKARQFEL